MQLEGLQVDGLVHVANLGRDYFRYEEDRKALVGERTGERFTLGDRLKVRVARVDPSERKIDFELVEREASAYHPRRRDASVAPGEGAPKRQHRPAHKQSGSHKPAQGQGTRAPKATAAAKPAADAGKGGRKRKSSGNRKGGKKR